MSYNLGHLGTQSKFIPEESVNSNVDVLSDITLPQIKKVEKIIEPSEIISELPLLGISEDYLRSDGLKSEKDNSLKIPLSSIDRRNSSSNCYYIDTSDEGDSDEGDEYYLSDYVSSDSLEQCVSLESHNIHNILNSSSPYMTPYLGVETRSFMNTRSEFIHALLKNEL